MPVQPRSVGEHATQRPHFADVVAGCFGSRHTLVDLSPGLAAPVRHVRAFVAELVHPEGQRTRMIGLLRVGADDLQIGIVLQRQQMVVDAATGKVPAEFGAQPDLRLNLRDRGLNVRRSENDVIQHDNPSRASSDT